MELGNIQNLNAAPMLDPQARMDAADDKKPIDNAAANSSTTTIGIGLQSFPPVVLASNSNAGIPKQSETPSTDIQFTSPLIFSRDAAGLPVVEIKDFVVVHDMNKCNLHFVNELTDIDPTTIENTAVIFVGKGDHREAYFIKDKKFVVEDAKPRGSPVPEFAAETLEMPIHVKFALKDLGIDEKTFNVTSPVIITKTTEKIAQFDNIVNKALIELQKKVPKQRLADTSFSHSMFIGQYGNKKYCVKRILRFEQQSKIPDERSRNKERRKVARELYYSEVTRLKAALLGYEVLPPECYIGTDKEGNYYLISDFIEGLKTLLQLKEEEKEPTYYFDAILNGSLPNVASTIVLNMQNLDNDAGLQNIGLVPGIHHPLCIIPFDCGQTGQSEKHFLYNDRSYIVNSLVIDALPKPTLQTMPYGYHPNNGYIDQIVGGQINPDSRFFDNRSLTSAIVRENINPAILVGRLVTLPMLNTVDSVVLGDYVLRAKLRNDSFYTSYGIYSEALNASPLSTGADLAQRPAAGTFQEYIIALCSREQLRQTEIKKYAQRLTTFTRNDKRLFDEETANNLITEVFGYIRPSIGIKVEGEVESQQKEHSSAHKEESEKLPAPNSSSCNCCGCICSCKAAACCGTKDVKVPDKLAAGPPSENMDSKNQTDQNTGDQKKIALNQSLAAAARSSPTLGVGARQNQAPIAQTPAQQAPQEKYAIPGQVGSAAATPPSYDPLGFGVQSLGYH